VSAEDLGFESPLCRYHSSWILWLRSVRELLPRKAGWVQHQQLVPHRYMQFVHKEHMFNRWHCVSPEERAYHRDHWWRILPLISRGIFLTPYYIYVPQEVNRVLVILFYVPASKCILQYSPIDTLHSKNPPLEIIL